MIERLLIWTGLWLYIMKTDQAIHYTRQSKTNKIYVKTNDVGQTFITNDNTVTIKSKPGIQQSWRLSYLVVEPT